MPDFDKSFTELNVNICCNNNGFISFRPRYSILGHVFGTDLYLDIENYKEVRAC